MRKKEKIGNEIYVRKIIGNPVKFLKQKQTIQSAVISSEPDDTIKIGSSSYDIKGDDIVINHSLNIIGGNSPKPSILFQKMRREIGMIIQNGKKVLLKSINILNKTDTIGIYVTPLFSGHLILDSITTDKPFLVNYDDNQPLIRYEGGGELTIKKSKIKSVVIDAPNAIVNIVDSEIGDLEHGCFIKASKVTITNSIIDQVHFETNDQLYIYNSTISSYIEINNNSYIRNLTLGSLNIEDSKYKTLEPNKPYIYLMPGSKTTIEIIDNEIVDKPLFYIKDAELWINGYEHINFQKPSVADNSYIHFEDNLKIPIE